MGLSWVKGAPPPPPPLPPSWPLAFQTWVCHSPWTWTCTWLYIQQTALGDKSDACSCWHKVRGSLRDHPVSVTPPSGKKLPVTPVHMPAWVPLANDRCSISKGKSETLWSILKRPVIFGKCLSGHRDLPASDSLWAVFKNRFPPFLLWWFWSPGYRVDLWKNMTPRQALYQTNSFKMT